MPALTSDIGLRTRWINDIELYTVSMSATEQFQAEAKQNSSMSNDQLERKLTAMVLASERMGKVLDQKYAYKFGGFRMIVNERTHKIETVGWYDDNHKSKVPKWQGDLLQEYYKKLGLSRSGNIKQEVD